MLILSSTKILQILHSPEYFCAKYTVSLLWYLFKMVDLNDKVFDSQWFNRLNGGCFYQLKKSGIKKSKRICEVKSHALLLIYLCTGEHR
jgi:hypothetical protein